MKIRLDFVTNSSSSSFVCEICGREITGYDLGLCEADMIECENGHVICSDEMLPLPSKKVMLDLIIANGYNKHCWDNNKGIYRDFDLDEINGMTKEELFNRIFSEDGSYNVKECCCPICQFVEYSDHDLSRFLEKEYKVDRAEVFAKVKALNKRRRKLYDCEYIGYVCKQFGLEDYKVVASWKERFGTYEKLVEYIGG